MCEGNFTFFHILTDLCILCQVLVVTFKLSGHKGCHFDILLGHFKGFFKLKEFHYFDNTGSPSSSITVTGLVVSTLTHLVHR